MDDLVSTDFIIGATFDESLIEEIGICLEGHCNSEVQISGKELLAPIQGLTSKVDYEKILMGFVRNGGAEYLIDDSSMLESTYLIDIDRCLKILHEQAVATRVLTLKSEHTDPTTVETIVTAPQGVELTKLARPTISSLPPRLRRLILEAQSSVRIANPYFDPNETIVDDIIALPRKGVKTKILTREVDIPDHVETINRFRDELTDNQLDNLELRDLFETDTSGRQTTATHAKIMIVDDTIAYLGSANLTTTSLGSNFEIGALIQGPPVDEVTAVFDMVFSTAEKIDFASDSNG